MSWIGVLSRLSVSSGRPTDSRLKAIPIPAPITKHLHRRLFLSEGAVNGLLGGAIGTLLALIPIIWLANSGWDLTATYGDMDIGYPVRGVIYPTVSSIMIFLIWLFTGVMATVAAWYPAVRASRLKAVEALRHV